jgi:hypothetical protein
MRRGAIQLGVHLRGSMQVDFYDQELSIEFESKAIANEASWLRLTYEMTDYWSGEDCKIGAQHRARERFGAGVGAMRLA